jgi:hypothetical protein
MSIFVNAVKSSARISREVADLYVPELEQLRRERAAASPFGFSIYGSYRPDILFPPDSSGEISQ